MLSYIINLLPEFIQKAYYQKVRIVFNDILEKADIRINGNRDQDIKTEAYDLLIKEVAQKGELGFMEAYKEEKWKCRNLTELFERLMKANATERVKTWSEYFQQLSNYLINYQTLEKSKEVVNIHYNLGNQFYKKMLGPTMQYSCAYWKDLEVKPENLTQAQLNKLDLIAHKLYLKKINKKEEVGKENGERVLDIGCGFGSLCYHFVTNYEVKEMIGVTLSEEQYKYCIENYKEEIKSGKLKFMLCDYRQLPNDLGYFDKIVSVGMFEHVGVKNYGIYSEVVEKHLTMDGIFLLHTIGKQVDSYKSSAFIRKYIFPNGQLPTCKEITASFSDKFIMEDWHNFGIDYAYTLNAWYNRFDKNRFKEEKMNRLWELYLKSCEAAFKTRNTQLWQIVFTKRGYGQRYISVR